MDYGVAYSGCRAMPKRTSLCQLHVLHDGEPDGELVIHVLDGCEPAMAVLYGRYARRCLALAHKLLGDQHRAEEVLQEVFIVLWQKPESFDPQRGSLVNWLLTITHRRSVDALRRERRLTPTSVEDLLERVPAAGPSIDDQLIATIEGENVRAALHALPEEGRRAIVLAYFGGYSQSEIALMTHTPLGTVKSRTRVAMATLRTSLSATAGWLSHGETAVIG
jgi:RNA polymerase sigma factor (sigma-70 family)